MRAQRRSPRETSRQGDRCMDILLAGDDPAGLPPVERALKEAGHRIVRAVDGAEAIQRLDAERYAVVIADIRLPHLDGVSLAYRVSHEHPDSRVIVLSGTPSIEEAVEAMRGRAAAYLPKPVDLKKLLEHVRQIGDPHPSLERSRDGAYAPPDTAWFLRSRSPAMAHLAQKIGSVASSNGSVLITGESGSGKDLVARVIHAISPRASGPFVAVNCGGVPESLLESEMFGHERGAFTGAIRKRDGRCKLADRGTLFLDEVADIPRSSQVKLLRFLQEHTFEPVGSDVSIRVDVRVIAATNRDIKKMVADGEFREDLLFRLKVFNLNVPPLRERRDDLDVLIADITDRILRTGEVRPFSRDARAALERYPFPGNVRELQGAIEHALAFSKD